MYSLQEQPEFFAELNERSRALLAELLTKLAVHGSEKRLPAQQDVFTLEGSAGKFFLIKDGVLTCRSRGRPIFSYEAGDLAGLLNQYHPSLTSVSTDFAVIVTEYSVAEFQNAIWSDPSAAKLWNEYITCQLNLIATILGSRSHEETDLSPRMESFEPGDIIIKQGDKSTDVFTLVEGALDVMVDDVKVGEVLQNEIFGALAAAADTFRTATVVARERSIVVVVPKEGFLSIVESKPATTLQLIQDMARTIVSLNKQVVGLERERKLSGANT